MRTVGEILKKKRLERKLNLEEIEQKLRIRKKFLLALEENDWGKLPSLPYIKGFIRNYSIFLGLPSEEMVAVFRRHFKEQEKAGLLPSGLTSPLNEPMLRLTPQIGLIGVVTSFLVLFFGYLFFQYKSYTSPPNLTIVKPQEGQTFTTNQIEIVGKTDADAVVSLNNEKIAVAQNGDFSTSISLSPGINTIVVVSTSQYGKKTIVTRTIQLQENP